MTTKKKPKAEDGVQSTLADDEMSRAMDWFNARIDPNGAKCPMCGSTDWSILPDIVGPLNISPTGEVGIGGDMYPHVMFVCDNCATTQFVNAVSSGIRKKS